MSQQQHQQQPPGLHDSWIRHQRRNHKTTLSFACIFCPDRRVFQSRDSLYQHALHDHNEKVPKGTEEELRAFRSKYEDDSAHKRTNSDTQARKPSYNTAATSQPEPPPMAKRPHPPTHSVSGVGLQALNIAENEDITMIDAGENPDDQPRKRAAVGSAGSRSPFDRESDEESPRRSKARTASHLQRSSDPEIHAHYNTQRPKGPKKQLWSAENDTFLPRTTYDTANIASLQANKSRAKFRKPVHAQPSPGTTRHQNAPAHQTPVILGHKSTPSFDQHGADKSDETCDFIKQPETRPISQEQLVAEVKGIYAGLVMVEAKCIEVDNKQAAVAQTDAAQKLNNEQWQALIALHRTLLHEHHDFFLASQHPSASPALRRLASKYAMPARMWRHGIHSFLELLRHRLPASRDHMLAFIYLAYSMMALLFETVPAFEDTWIECLGDLGRYRMAIEDDDQRDREVWTSVARHWYSKASDKAPTTGRLYHHLAILARPNALQQLFYYAKSLCVVIPFTSARESILTLFEPVLTSENGQGQFRLPPLDTAFVKAHGVLFTNKEIERYEPAVHEFLGLLDGQIGRVTRKFMEQGYYISITNSVAVLGFASKENPVMKAISSNDEDSDTRGASANELSFWMTSFKHAQRLHNATLVIVLQRLGDPNVLPFIHCALVFMLRMSQHADAMDLLEADFPWDLLAIMLNTLVAGVDLNRVQNDVFPIPVNDEARPLPEDYILRGILYADHYFPDTWFATKVDQEEKYQERASMTAQRKERILFVAFRIATSSRGLKWDSSKGQFSRVEERGRHITRSSTIESSASATTTGTTRSATWQTQKTLDDQSDMEDSQTEKMGP